MPPRRQPAPHGRPTAWAPPRREPRARASPQGGIARHRPNEGRAERQRGCWCRRTQDRGSHGASLDHGFRDRSEAMSVRGVWHPLCVFDVVIHVGWSTHVGPTALLPKRRTSIGRAGRKSRYDNSSTINIPGIAAARAAQRQRGSRAHTSTNAAAPERSCPFPART